MIRRSLFVEEPVSSETLDTGYYLSTAAGAAVEAQSREFGVDPEDALFAADAVFFFDDTPSRSFLESLST